MKQRLVIFDFDGTLTYRDSMIEFVRYYHGTKHFFLGMMYLFPQLLLYKLNFIPNYKAKEIFLSYFFRNEPIHVFQKKANKFSEEIIPSFIIPSALRNLEQHKKDGDDVVIISSSAEDWLGIWCTLNKVNLIATVLEKEDNLITGKLDGPNCYGPEKVNRLKQSYDLSTFDEIIVYGDSEGDHALFEISTQHFYKYFH